MKRWMVWMLAVVLAVCLGGGMAFAEGKIGSININTADEAALVTLHQIGKAKAQAIIQYRQEYGPFKTVEELKNVSGIGDRVFEVIREKVTVGGGQP